MIQQKTKVFKPVFLQIIFICFCGVQLCAQPNNAAFRNLTSANGLPSLSVSDITQDAFGFIWIATWDGDYRYDGHTFKKIPGVFDGRYLTADKKGGVWISFEYSIGYFNSRTDSLRNYKIFTKNRFPEIIIDNAGTVWATSSNGILKFDTHAGRFINENGQKQGNINDLNAWGNGKLLFKYVDGKEALIGRRSAKGKYTYEPFPEDQNNPEKRKSFFHWENLKSNLNQWPVFVREIDTTRILIINRFGWAFKSLKGGEWRFKKPLNANLPLLPSDVKLDNKGNLWLNMPNMISRINIDAGMVTCYKNDLRNPGSALTLVSSFYGSNMFIDRQGVLWIASYSRGISRLNLYENDFGLLKDTAGVPIKDILSALELKDGSYWIGSRTIDPGLIHYAADGKIIRKYSGSFESPRGRTISVELSHPFAWSLAQSGDGSIWVGTGSPGPERGGLNRIRPGTDQITRYKNDPNDPSSLIGNWIDKICVDGSDRVWVSTIAGLCYIDPVTEKITRGIGPKADVANSNPYNLEMVTSAGDIVISESPQGKTYIVDHKTFEKRPVGINTPPGEGIRYVYQDGTGKLFFYSKKRFGYLDPSFSKIAYAYNYKEKSFPADQVVAINSDKEGKFWLATDNGIVKFDPATEKSIDFGFERGLQGNDFQELMDYRSPSGKIYFNGTGGINIFDPESIKSNPFPPEMVFTGLKLDGKPIAWDKASAIKQPIYAANTITVGPDVLAISVYFSAIHFAGFEANRYQYRLEGFDKDWRDGGTIGNANYTNLSPGKYTLYIKGSNLDDVWSDGKKSIAIIILPPWWETWWAYVLYALILVWLLWCIYEYQKARTIRAEREKTRQRELAQAKEIEKAYHELKTTQAQLIQSEKMASLGELTAGIAHEIQNPLNFVNNFSEVNKELLEELKAESIKPKAERDGQLETDLINDLIENESKITHHGKRADFIVKGMLEHSRTSTGERQPTDLNVLCDEFMKLSYHGLRAKDKSFNAELVTNFDPDLQRIDMVQQDMGRVLVNLFNNAFYAVNQKQKTAVADYKPIVEVSTSANDGQIIIKVKDNGNGIPDAIKDKIMQPFFTTKPTGEGTGLGLSLSYDIVVKGHGGRIDVSTKEGEYTEFTVSLPNA